MMIIYKKGCSKKESKLFLKELWNMKRILYLINKVKRRDSTLLFRLFIEQLEYYLKRVRRMFIVCKVYCVVRRMYRENRQWFFQHISYNLLKKKKKYSKWFPFNHTVYRNRGVFSVKILTFTNNISYKWVFFYWQYS